MTATVFLSLCQSTARCLVEAVGDDAHTAVTKTINIIRETGVDRASPVLIRAIHWLHYCLAMANVSKVRIRSWRWCFSLDAPLPFPRPLP